ncbi:MAG: hypothetical protein WBB22_03660 [Anaerolineae bacterium]
MPNLFWKSGTGETINVVETGFGTEDALEEYIQEHPEVLGELFIIARQTRSATRRDQPDLIAVDADGQVVIIELKKDTATEDAIPQVLRYAIWAETNPDSIKAIWLEAEDRPEDLEINFDALRIKIMIIAPSIAANVLRLVNRITYDVELVEIARFAVRDSEFVLITQREPAAIEGIRTTVTRQKWDEDFYRKEHHPKSVDGFMRAVRASERLIKQKEWHLETKFNKWYVGFKHGFPNVFAVAWLGSRSYALWFKVPKEVAEAARIEGYPMLRYQTEFKQALYKIGSSTDILKFLPLIEKAYENITGLKA